MHYSILVVFLALLSVVQCFAQSSSRLKASSPLIFEPNRGQTSEQTRFVVHGSGYQAAITDDGVSVRMRKPEIASAAAPNTPTTVHIRWLGVEPGSTFIGEAPLKSYSNYFRGSDSAQWQTRVPHYSAVKEANVRPGLDVRYYANAHQQLEYDLALSSYLQVSQVGFEVQGADRVRIGRDGGLVLKLGEATFHQPTPRTYEWVGRHKRYLRALYIQRSPNTVGFRVYGRTPGSRLVIDPVLRFSTYLGGSTNGDTFVAITTGASTAVDNAGNIYVTGVTNAIDFPTTSNAFEPKCPNFTCGSGTVVFVSKFDQAERILLYSTYLTGDSGGSATTAGKQLAVDTSGNVYVAGQAYSDFPVTGSAFQQYCGTSTTACAFLAKLSSDGTKLLYSTLFGSTNSSLNRWTGATGVALGPTGDAYISGWTNAADLLTTTGSYQPSCGVCLSGFVARLNTNKSGQASLVYATYLGGAGKSTLDASEADGIAVDPTGNAFVVGLAASDSFPHQAAFGSGTGPQSTRGQANFAGVTYVAKLNPSGNALVYSTLLRGASGTSIALDSVGQAFVTGAARNGLATTPGASQATFQGGSSDAFVTKLSISGSGLQYSTFVGGSGNDFARDVVVNNYGLAFITGYTDSANYPTLKSAFQPAHSSGGNSSYVTALQSDGTSLYYSTFLGGSHNTDGNGIAMDPAWNAYVVGTTADADFPVTPPTFQPKLAGSFNAFLSRVIIVSDLRLTVSPNPVSVAHNSVVNFRFRIVNLGPDGSDNVSLSDWVQSGWAYAGVYSPNATSCTQPAYGSTGGTLVCRKTRLELGETLYVNVYLRAIGPAGSWLYGTPRASSQTQDLYQPNNYVLIQTRVY